MLDSTPPSTLALCSSLMFPQWKLDLNIYYLICVSIPINACVH